MNARPAPASVAADMFAWIAQSRRDLPWRRNREPYAAWVSEVMLQQTQVATVAAYFERWMARFPDVTHLAAASLDDALKAWEGLGYYARARNLHRAAQIVMAEHGGNLPAERQALERLPGIGRSTAGAILSLAFGQRQPVLDSNIRRVLCRLYDIAEDPRTPAVQRRLWALAEGLVQAAPAEAAGDLNEALMELGALICTAAAPQCRSCPLAALCLAHSRGVELNRPAKTVRKPTPHYDVTAGVIANTDGDYLIVQRPLNGLLGGLWGFPGGTAAPDESPEACLRRAVRDQVGLAIEPDAAIIVIKHAYTHFRITLHAWRCRLLSGEPQPLGCATVRWVSPAGLTAYPFPITDQRIIRAL